MNFLKLFLFFFFIYNHSSDKRNLVINKFKDYTKTLKSKDINKLSIDEIDSILNKIEEIIIELIEIKSNYLRSILEIYNKFYFYKYKKFNIKNEYFDINKIKNNILISDDLKNKILNNLKISDNDNFILNLINYYKNILTEKIEKYKDIKKVE